MSICRHKNGKKQSGESGRFLEVEVETIVRVMSRPQTDNRPAEGKRKHSWGSYWLTEFRWKVSDENEAPRLLDWSLWTRERLRMSS